MNIIHLALFVLIKGILNVESCFSNLNPASEPVLKHGIIKKFSFDSSFAVYAYEASTPVPISSYIIQLQTRLIIFDAQYTLSAAQELLNFALSLKKPIDRLIISHSHPDHFFGSQVFRNVTNIYALNETIDEIKKLGPFYIANQIPTVIDKVKTITLPNIIQEEKSETLDGIQFIYKKVQKAETEFQLVLLIPKYSAMFVGDLIFNKVHLFLADQYFENWIQNLEYLSKYFPSANIFPGHLERGDSTLFQSNINYLNDVKLLLHVSNDFDYFKTKLVNKYPEYQGSFLIDFYKSTFPKQTILPAQLKLVGSNCFPESVGVLNGFAYISCFNMGGIQIYDFNKNNVTSSIGSTNTDGLTSTWGVKVDTYNDWLFVCRNPPFGNTNSNLVAQLRIYSIADGGSVDWWIGSYNLLPGSICHSITFDNNDDVYIADAGIIPRIFKLDTNTNSLKVWKTSNLWVPYNGVGLNGIFSINSSIYVHGASEYLYKIDINKDGSAGAMNQVNTFFSSNKSSFSLRGAVGSTYAKNNVVLMPKNGVPGAQGTLNALQLDNSGLNGAVSTIATGLNNPTSVTLYNNNIFVPNSQLGYLFGYETGSLPLPFTVSIIPYN